MAMLNGHPSTSPVFIGGASSQPPPISIGGPVNGSPAAPNQAIIDGTPVRVVTYALAAAAGLWALRIAGFKFNVGVSA